MSQSFASPAEDTTTDVRLGRFNLLRFVLVLLFMVLGSSQLAAQASPPEVSLEDLLGSHRVLSGRPWQITIVSSVETKLTGRQQLPPNGVIHLLGSAVWTLEGGTLDLAGSTIDAPEDRRIFAGSGHVAGMAEARPEWFADAVDGVYPEGALRAAYAAVKPGGTIRLREASYISPFFDPFVTDPCAGNAVRVDSSLTLEGVKRPVPDSDSEPKRLVGGSILRGGICAAAVLHASHLGVDVGDLVNAQSFKGARAFGIQLRNGGALGALAGTTIEDVSVLAAGFQNQHSVFVDGQRDALVRSLWVWTPGGDHGLVMKSLSSAVNDLHCKGARFDCLILKSDYVTDHEGNASGSKVDGVFISYLKMPGDTGGITLEGRWDRLDHLELNNIQEDGLKNGIIAIDSGLYRLEDVLIQHWTATNMTGQCLFMDGGARVVVDHFVCSEGRMDQPWAFYLGGRETTLRNGRIECKGGASCNDPAKDGIVDEGRNNRIEAVTGFGLGGYLVRTSSHRGGTAIEALDATGMRGRTASIYVRPHRPIHERVLAQWTVTKPYLRLIWTRTQTTLYSLGVMGKALVGAVILFVVLLQTKRRPR